MCDFPPENAHVYVHDCLLKYLCMLEQSDSVDISLAAYKWRQHISTSNELMLNCNHQQEIMGTQVMGIEFGGEIVGYVKNAIPDMWQMEGDWMASDCSQANRFESMIAEVNAADVVSNVRTGMVIRCLPDQSDPYMAYALGLNENRLVFRKFSSAEDSEWAGEQYKSSQL